MSGALDVNLYRCVRDEEVPCMVSKSVDQAVLVEHL
jgi:hypothetical protein